MKELLVAMIVMQITVFAGKHDRVNMPANVSVTLPESVAEVRSVLLRAPDGTEVVGQLTKPGVLFGGGAAPEGQVRRELHFIVPKLKAGERMTLEGTIKPGDKGTAEGFKWYDTAGEFSELRFGERPVLRSLLSGLIEVKNELVFTYRW